MTHSRHLFILAASVIVLLGTGVSCKDKNKKTYCEENPGGCQSVLVAKDFFLFKEGSWWVYEEETSHERDSVYVTQSVNNPNNYDFDITLYSVYQDFNYYYAPFYVSPNGCSPSAPVSQKCIYINRSKGRPGEFVGEDKCFFVNFKKDDWSYAYNNIYYPNNKISISEVSENYTLGQLSFGRTVKVHELSTLIEGVQPTNHYFSKNVGLIRKELLDSNQVWNLVSYHIEP